MIKYCPNCRLEYSISEVACEICKVNLVSYEEVPPSCPVCKKVYSFQDSFCEKCLVELDFFQNIKEDININELEYVELVTIYETSNLAELAIIKGMFEENNIHYNARGENLQNLFGIGLIGGFNPMVGSIKIDVAEKDVDEAREIIKEITSK
jgi:hypothetical protein